MSSQNDDIENIEGPYWDFNRINERITMWRNTFACVTADELLRGQLEYAHRAAAEYNRLDTQLQRVGAYYDDHKHDPRRWIGWHP